MQTAIHTLSQTVRNWRKMYLSPFIVPRRGFKVLFQLYLKGLPENFSFSWCQTCRFLHTFYTPVFRRDVLWYGDVRPSGSPSVRPSVRSSQFSTLFSYMLWDIELKFCVSLYFYARKIKFECHQFPSIFARVMPLLNFKPLQICSFLHFLGHRSHRLQWPIVITRCLASVRRPSVRPSSVVR